MMTSKEADHVYVLMTDKYRISRNSRAQWYCNHLNKNVVVQPFETLDKFNNEIDLVSILPSHYQDYHDLGSDTQYSGQYFISANTKITFFSRRYRLAYVLDLSPSVSAVDIQRNKVLVDEVFSLVATSLRGLVQPFYVPGSRFLFGPEIFITAIAYIPFYCSDNHHALAQGWKVTAQNIESFLSYLHSRLTEIISSLSEISAKAKDERDDNQSESDVLIGSLFDENENKKSRSSQTLMVTPDISMVNMLRFGLLALQLLPENSSAGIVIVTDGMLSLPNANTLESALTQLRYHTISCSFLQVGSAPHPHSCLGYVPYTDLMKFISTATFGAYLSSCPEISSPNGGQVNHDFNLYHRAFFAWNFQRGLFGFRADVNHKQIRNATEWTVDNAYFYSTHDYGLNSNRETRDQQTVRNKQIENTVSAQLTQVLSCRLREGYTIKSVNYIPNENQVEIHLVLPWRHNVNIEYNLTSSLPPTSNSQDSNSEEQPECHYEVIVEGSYNFLHDVTCAIKKPIKSPYRSATIKQFWSTLKSLSDSDKLEIHLHNFTKSSGRNVPESIKNGVPLFYMPPNSNDPVLSSKNIVHSQFAQYWRPICMLDVNICQKWMHTHRINVVLEHDMPLPKHLHVPNTSGRYINVQCRQALSSLSVLLKESSSFVLLENHSYIKLLQNSANESPHSFYLIRVVSQPPCIVIYLAFIGGTSGRLRHEIVSELKERIKSCKLPKRSISTISYQKGKNSVSNDTNDSNEGSKSDRKTTSPLQREWVDVNCCILINKPIEKMLIRYDRMPKDFMLCYDKHAFHQNDSLNGSHSSHASHQHLSSFNMFQTLSRYLYHQRWIWTTHSGTSSRLTSASLAKILSVLTKMRIQEGFHFAHNDSGIINMIRELSMKDENDYQFSCVLQYIIFPPHVMSGAKDSLSDDEEFESAEDDGELQLITECWVEPQHGVSLNCNQRNKFLEGLSYKEVSQAFYPIDLDAISSLLTFEHLLIMCQNPDANSQVLDQISTNDNLSPDHHSKLYSSLTLLGCSTPDISSVIHSSPQSERIKTVKFSFDLIQLLPKCQQAVIMFSTMFQRLNKDINNRSHFSDATNELLFELLISKIERIHDREIILSQNDVNCFITQVNERSRHSLFELPVFSDRSNSVENSGKLRCFCRKVNTNSVIITIIAASFRDLKFLVFGSAHQSIDSSNKFHIIDDQNWEESPYGSLALPIFIYKSSFTALSDQLIYLSDGKRLRDIYLDNTYKSQSNDSSHLPFKSFEANEKESETLPKSSSLKQFCRTVQMVYWNSMTQALYRSLQLEYYVDKRDILKVVENICDKTLLKIDISKFLIYICEHLKDYFLKNYCNQPNSDISDYIESNFNPITELSSDTIPESAAQFKSISLTDLLQSTKSCADMKGLHMDIKEKFQQTLKNYLSPIPCFPSYYFFNCRQSEASESYLKFENELSESNLIEKSCTTDDETAKSSTVVTEAKTVTDRDDKISDDSCSNNNSTQALKSKNEALEESGSLSKSISSKVSCNAMDMGSDDTCSMVNLCANSKNDSSTTNTYLDTSSQPLFLRLSCSINTRRCSKECSLNFLPTCLEEIICLIESDASELELQDLRVTLNLICLTQSNEIELPMVPLLQKRESVVSNDCPNYYYGIDQTCRENSINDKLSDYQFQALNECISRVNWLLKDEIACVALDSYTICESTLEMVIAHIENSPYSDFCFKKQVQLQFVFGSAANTNFDISLNRFCDSMGQIKLPGFQLKRVGQYYYISYDNELKDQQGGTPKYLLNSLIPALSSNPSFHFDDEANLHQICSKPVSNDTVSHVRNNDRKILFSTPLPSNILRSAKETRRDRENLSEDSCEDSESGQTRKRHVIRKNPKNRSASVPPSSSNVTKEEPRKPGQSLPEADFEFIKKLKNQTKSNGNEELNENEKELINSTEKSSESTFLNTNDRLKTELSSCSELEKVESCTTIQTDEQIIPSNAEDAGYDGDSDSDSDIESLNWLALDSRQPLVPKFWLIMKINNGSVSLYFHTRPKDTSSDNYTKGIEIFNHVVGLVESVCKTVNQMLLLENLHDSRMCDELLVPIEDNDPWNRTSRRSALSRSQLAQSSELETDLEPINPRSPFKLMKTNVTFSPGLFSCDIIWKKHFPLHHRLQSSGPSKGIRAMRQVLNSFSVNNRENLFVYQESSGSVFYLRLYEIDCVHHNYNQEIKSLNCSKSPSESSLIGFQSSKKTNSEETSGSRIRHDSNKSDRDRDKDNDNLSLTSYASSHIYRVNSDKQPHQCILLHVHGIREVGKDIKEDMVGALQKKLDEAVLELLILMLSRNPHSKLTPEDVCFIQKSNKEPTDTFQFIVDSQYLEYIHSIRVYLRQNLLTSMHNPKYTELNPEHHFKVITSSGSIVTNDSDTFLYWRQQASGSDSKGIACIILSLVDGNGDPLPHKSCPPLFNVGRTELKALLAGSFDDVTKCERYNGKSSSESVLLIQFQIWSVGKIDLQQLSKMLEVAIKHAIWDLTLEFKLLKASLSDQMEITAAISNTISVSEPSTPTNIKTSRGRRTGRVAIESSQVNPLKRLEVSRDMSSSVPNILKLILDKTSLLSAENVFKFPDSNSKQIENQNESKSQPRVQIRDNIEECDPDEMANLSCTLNLLIRPWLDYGRNLEVVTVVKQQYSVLLRHSVPYVIKEFKTYVQNMSSHTCLNSFKKTSDFIYIPCDDFEFLNDSEFENITNMIILARHEKLWRTSKTSSGDNTFLENIISQTKHEKPKLRFLPHLCNMKGDTLMVDLNKPLLAASSSSLNSNPSESKTIGPDPINCIAPRQKFLLLYVEDKAITLYLYNWSNEYFTSICKNLSNIVSWHNSRGSFLQSIISQKAGIFHNQAFKRKNSNQLINSYTNSKQVGSSSNLSQYFKNQKQRFNSFSASMNENIELLIKHHSPAAAAQEHSQNKKMFPLASASCDLLNVYRNCSNLTSLQKTKLSSTKDLVTRFGKQIKFCEGYRSKDLEELSKIWHTQGTKIHNPMLEKLIKQVKRIGRLNHYCLTPLLFSPKWRFTVSPIRDHSLQTLDVIEEDTKEMQFIANNHRLRHASGGYIRKTEESEVSFNRSRRLSGPAVSGSAPKLSADETWHFAVCTHYIQEYVQYLQTLGFGAIHMRSHRILSSLPKQKLPTNDENLSSTHKIMTKPFPHRKFSSKSENERYFLVKSLLGGLLVFEVGFCEPYVYSHLYSFDSKRFETWSKSRKSIDASLCSSFLDELDKIKVTMHLHSFTYDYHLRTIHSYISGRQLIFRQGYHLTSFLDDFIKYYQKAPNYARNYVYAGQMSIHNTFVPSHQLYNYIISHNDMYGMKVFRMNSPVSVEDDLELTNEYVLVELSSHRVPYKDTNDIRQIDNFDVGVLITHDYSNCNSNNNTLSLKFFVLLTSQRELFPKLFSSHFGASSKGSFKPIRLYSSQPSSGTHSRKSSTITDPNSDGSLTDGSLKSTKETIVSSSSAITSISGAFEKNSLTIKSLPLLSTSAGICDEEITYLGYFSSHETMMLQILQDKAKETELQLAAVVKQATIDCRRDYLWSCLLPRKNINIDNEDVHLNIKEFNELLGLVHIIRLDQYDKDLLPFIGLHISWYHGLAKILISKFGMSYRNFSSADGRSIKLVFSHSTCLDCFMLLNINTNSALAGLNLVFKKRPINDNIETYLGTCSTQCHTLVEDFVNGCAYYMWSAIQ